MERPGQNNSMEDVSQEEVSKLTRAMKDPQFQSHMDDYCKEISDPAHRKEYLQYLDQLEAKGEMPEGQQLLRTEPGCCVKTTIMFKNGQKQKCFINIVHSERLADMSEVPDAKGGKQVQLPYSLSPPRPERDNKDENCMTCDFAVSTWTFGQAIQRPNVLKMLVDTASDGLTAQFLKGHEEVRKDFKVMRRIKCRGPFARPLPMSVKGEMLKDKGKCKNAPYTSSIESKSAVTPSELREMRKDAKAKQLKPPETKDDDEDDVVPVLQDPEPSTTASGAPRIRVPKHKLIHSGAYDLTDFMEASNRPTNVAISIPRMLKLVVELPSVKKSGDISLDVTPTNVCIEVEGKYYLDLPLSYEIEHEKGDAKFDKVKQTLTLELPVKLKAPDLSLVANRGGFPVGGATEEEDDEDGGLRDGEDEEDELPPLEDPPADPPAPEPELQPPTPPQPQQAPRRLPNEDLPMPANEDLVSEEDLLRFIPSDSFTGSRQGYYFGLGDDGLGYYRDVRQRRPARDAAVGESSRKSAGILDVRPKATSASLPTRDGNGHLLADRGAPLIEEIDAPESRFIPSGFQSAKSSSAQAPRRAPLPRKAQQYVEASSLLTSHIAAADVEDSPAEAQPSLGCHQTRQNLLLLVGIAVGREVAGLQLSLVNRRLTISFCTRQIGAKKWRRHHLRRSLCRAVDIRQWHAEAPKTSKGADNKDAPLLIVLRKSEPEQGERWPEVFDTSAAAVAADREPVVVASDITSPVDTSPLIECVADHTAAGGAEGDAIEDSAELDIVVPAGTPAVLGPTAPGGAKGTPVPFNASAASAAAQSASVMGQAVLLRTRLMYQLF